MPGGAFTSALQCLSHTTPQQLWVPPALLLHATMLLLLFNMPASSPVCLLSSASSCSRIFMSLCAACLGVQSLLPVAGDSCFCLEEKREEKKKEEERRKRGAAMLRGNYACAAPAARVRALHAAGAAWRCWRQTARAPVCCLGLVWRQTTRLVFHSVVCAACGSRPRSSGERTRKNWVACSSARAR